MRAKHIFFLLNLMNFFVFYINTAEQKIAQEDAEQQELRLRLYAIQYRDFLDFLAQRNVEGATENSNPVDPQEKRKPEGAAQKLKKIRDMYLNQDKNASSAMKKRIVEALLGRPFVEKIKPTEEFNKFYKKSENLLDAVYGFVSEYENFRKFYTFIEQLLQQKRFQEALSLFDKEDEQKLNVYKRLDKLLGKYLTVKDDLKALDIIQQALDYPKPSTTKVNRQFFNTIYENLNKLRQQAVIQLEEQLREKGSYRLRQYEHLQDEFKALIEKLSSPKKELRIREELAQAIQRLKMEQPALYEELKTPEVQKLVQSILKEAKEASAKHAQLQQEKVLVPYKGPIKPHSKGKK